MSNISSPVAVFAVEFNECYAFSPRLLGRNFGVWLQDGLYIRFLFPIIKDHKLVSSLSNNVFGKFLTDFKSQIYTFPNDIYPEAIPCLDHIDIQFFSSDPSFSLFDNISDIHDIVIKQVEGILKNLRVLAPKAILHKNASTTNLLTAVHNITPHWSEINMGISYEAFFAYVDTSVLVEAFVHNSDNLSVHWELYSHSWDNFRRGDYRGCVLQSASVIELCLTKVIDEYFSTNGIPEEIINYIRSKINGIDGKIGFIKKVQYHAPEIEGISDIKSIRDKTTHGKYNPSKAEAIQALNIAESFLNFYSIEKYQLQNKVIGG